MVHHSRFFGCMQKDSKLFEDMAKMASGATGAFMDLKREIESAVADKLERLVMREKFVTRDEFELVKEMVVKAREENEALRVELATLQQSSTRKK